MRHAALEVRRARNGVGLFATRPYRKDQRIIRIVGRLVAADVVTRRGGAFADNCFRFGPETYLDPGAAAGAYLNQSCEPNACVRKSNNRLFLVAFGRIRRSDEIVIDYSTILGDDDIWTMRCTCGSGRCRKVIRRFGSLPAALKVRYAESGAVPKYVLDTLA